MPPSHTAPSAPDSPHTGTAHEFAEFCKRERQRRANMEGDFDPTLFDEAVDYVWHKLASTPQAAGT